MNRIAKMLALTVLAMALCAAPALAQVVAEGTVACGRAVMVTASAGGTLSDIPVQPGDFVQADDVVASLSTTPYYAPCDGTVEIIFAGAGESAEDASAKYGGVMTLVPENCYRIYATSEYAYKSARTSRIAAGQTVYLKCTADGSHRGTGVITEIDGEIFYVEATGGTFYNGETVYLYMEDDYDTVDRLGKGTVVATAVRAVTGTGDVARLFVDEEDFVEKGQLLFETLGALPDGEAGDGRALAAGVTGYVTEVYAEANAQIERDAPLLAVCPADALIAVAQVPEADLGAIRVGDSAALSFNLTETTRRLEGTVQFISYLGSTDAEGRVSYEVRIALDAEPGIAPGMSATVTFD